MARADVIQAQGQDFMNQQLLLLMGPESQALQQKQMDLIGKEIGLGYDAGFAAGAASVGAPAPVGISADQEKSDIDAAVASAVKPLNDQISALSLAKESEDALLASVKSTVSALLASLG